MYFSIKNYLKNNNNKKILLKFRIKVAGVSFSLPIDIIISVQLQLWWRFFGFPP
jgi:hypothetical protein